MDLLKPLTVFSVEQYKEAVLYFQEEYLAHGETLILDPIINWDSTDNVAEQRESVTEAQRQEYATYAWRLERENKPKGFTLSWSQWKGMLRNE